MRRVIPALIPATALAISLSAVDLPLYSVGPGPARDVAPLIDIDGTRTFASNGSLLLTTVSVVPVTVFEALRAWTDPVTAVVREREVIPRGQTGREYEAALAQQMDESQVAAIAVALGLLTGYPEDHRPGAMVQQVVPGHPAEGHLVPGDLIVAVNGRRVPDVEGLSEAIRRAGTRRMLRLTVESGGERRDEAVRAVRDPDQDRAVIGVVVVENFPFDVRISSGGVGGPSAGLMWALGVVDLLTPDDLTGGRTIAGTGSLDLEGHVLPIGGVEEKAVAAERAGAQVFLVPEGNYAEARAVAEEIRLVAVRTVKQAMRWLERRSVA